MRITTLLKQYQQKRNERSSAEPVAMRSFVKRRGLQLVAVALILAPVAYAWDSASANQGDNPAANDKPHVQGSTTMDLHNTDSANSDQSADANNAAGSAMNENTSSGSVSSDVTSNSSSSSSVAVSGGDASTNVNINGQDITVPPHGHITKHITTDNGSTSVSASSSSSGSDQSGNSSNSSVQIHINSNSSNSMSDSP